MSKLLVLFFVLAGIFFAIVFGMTNYLSNEDELEKADAIIAVSGGDTMGRARKAINLYTKGYAPLIVFSGAAKDPSSPSNARVMQELAVESGVPASDIRIDEFSRDTQENAAGVKDQLGQSKKIILVTSEYHQRRAHKEMQKALPNVEIVDAPADDKNWSPVTWWLTPYGWWITSSEVVKNVL